MLNMNKEDGLVLSTAWKPLYIHWSKNGTNGTHTITWQLPDKHLSYLPSTPTNTLGTAQYLISPSPIGPATPDTVYINTTPPSHNSYSLSAFEDGPDRGFRNVGTTHSDAGEIPKRKYTTFRTWR
jgi:hypothetical protein